jgi:hypothetical protein
VLVVALAATFLLARGRYAWAVGSLAMMLALPRFLIYEISFAVVGLVRERVRS